MIFDQTDRVIQDWFSSCLHLFSVALTQSGVAAAWFRLTIPLVHGLPTSSAMRVAAAADFGNGLSRILPFDH